MPFVLEVPGQAGQMEASWAELLVALGRVLVIIGIWARVRPRRALAQEQQDEERWPLRENLPRQTRPTGGR